MLSEQSVLAQTRCWVESVVIKHNFCPFAHKPFKNDKIRMVACMSDQAETLVEQLFKELQYLNEADHERVETTLLVAPNCLQDFLDYNQFLDVVDAVLDQLDLNGIIQVASFHPQYQFADLDADDVRNYTNRSPYPTFHLILEDSIEQARATYPDVDGIPERNMQLLLEMGLAEAQRQLQACVEVEIE